MQSWKHELLFHYSLSGLPYESSISFAIEIMEGWPAMFSILI